MSKIEWTDESWNPVIGCSKIGEGCLNCYAEKMANRLRHMEKNRPADKRYYANVVTPAGWNGRTHYIQRRMIIPLRWKKPRRIFISSMGDLFHRSIFFDSNLYSSIFHIISKCPQHTFIMLTKRPARMEAVFKNYLNPVFDNLWLGVSCENQKAYDERWAIASQIPAAVLFVSGEPLLGPIDITKYERKPDWFIVGCESGPGRRNDPGQYYWAKDLRDQCFKYKIPFFLKQLEGYSTVARDDFSTLVKSKVVSMPKLDGRVWDQMPETK